MINAYEASVIRRFSFSSEILEHELVEFIKNVIFCNIPWHFCPCVVFSDFCIETKSMVKLIHIELYKIFIKKVFYRFTDLQFYRFTVLQIYRCALIPILFSATFLCAARASAAFWCPFSCNLLPM